MLTVNVRPMRAVSLISRIALAIGTGILIASCSRGPSTSEVEQRSRIVMPFDLNKTMHMFQDTPSGGIETVVANQPDDQTQIRLIRQHLQKEATLFARGDFSDPAFIHTAAMPGLATLQANAARLSIRYHEVPAGANIVFTTTDPHLVDAVHTWFAAQVKEHGSHAMKM